MTDIKRKEMSVQESVLNLQKMRESILQNELDLSGLLKYKKTDFRRKIILEHLSQIKKYSRLTKRKVTVPYATQPKTSKIRIDTSKAHSNTDVVRLACQKLRWREYPMGNSIGPCEICWNGLNFLENPGFPGGLVSRFPRMNELLHKINLSRTLDTMRQLFPSDYDFYPITFYLPFQMQEFSQFASDYKKKTFIVKPDSGCQGDGIYLIKEPSDYKNYGNKNHVVQEYLSSPFLIDGYKFDLRIYVLIKNIDPLELYICKEGLVRLCTEKYEKPTPKNMNEFFMHLTNYSLNKKSNTYVHSDQDGEGSKRTLTNVFHHIESRGYDVTALWDEIESVCCKTIVAILPELTICVFNEIPPTKPGPRCFQILGFDILILENLKPVLLEVNANPSLRLDFECEIAPGIPEYFVSTIDVQIKKPLILDTLRLVSSMVVPLSAEFNASDHVDGIYPSLQSLKRTSVNSRTQETRSQNSSAGSGYSHAVKALKQKRKEKQTNKPRSLDLDTGNANREVLYYNAKGNDEDDYEDESLNQDVASPVSDTNINNTIKQNETETPALETSKTESNETCCQLTASCQPSPSKQSGNANNKTRNWIKTNRKQVSLASAKLRSNSTDTGKTASRLQDPKGAGFHPYTDEYWDEDESCLAEIYPCRESDFGRFRVLESITEVFIAAIGIRANLKMGSNAFRNFARKCNLQQFGLNLPSVDIMFIDFHRRWEYLSDDSSAGLCFQGFVEVFFKLASLYSSRSHRLSAVLGLIEHCQKHMGLIKDSQTGGPVSRRPEALHYPNNSQTVLYYSQSKQGNLNNDKVLPKIHKSK